MSEWKAYGKVTAKVAAPEGRGVCDECGKFFESNDLISLNGRHICGGCKPTVVQQMQEGSDSSDDAIRNAHLKHEASIQSVGTLYLLGGCFIGLGGLALLFSGMEGVLAGLIVIALAGFNIWTAICLRKLKPGAKVGTGIISGIGLLGVPFGTLISAYILYLVFSKKGTYIFSDEYAGVRERTPHIKHRTSIIVIVFVVLLLAMMAMGVVGLVFSPGPR
ncbi:MAG: hypothetical protein ACPGVU_18155 [Limisphaerales bacterium]